MAAQQENIYQKLAKIRKQVEVIQKNRDGYGYKYVSEDEILSKITVFMDRYGLSLIPGIVPSTAKVEPYTYEKTKASKGTVYQETVNEILVTADTVWTWVNNDNPSERIEVPWVLVGQQSDASQAFGSGLTYSGRYFLLKYFNVATPDADPDLFRSKQRQAELDEKKLIAAETINMLDETIRTFLKINKDKSEEVKKFISKYVKDGDYRTIVEPALASKLLEDFKKNFDIKEAA